MLEIPRDVSQYFFDEIQKRGKYKITFNESKIIISPRLEEQYYKPQIIVKNLVDLDNTLNQYLKTIQQFYQNTNFLKEYHDASYFFNNLFYNMTVTDALDLNQYIQKKISFFENDSFSSFLQPFLIFSEEQLEIYVQKINVTPGLESPYLLSFFIKTMGAIYELPFVRCAIDSHSICHLFTIQFGRKCDGSHLKPAYKDIVNKINKGVHKYRNVSPSFVYTFFIFLEILMKESIDEIMIPDYHFGHYRKYYNADTVVKSDIILNRIFNHMQLLCQRMEYQFPFFEIKSYSDLDSFIHIHLNKEKKLQLEKIYFN